MKKNIENIVLHTGFAREFAEKIKDNSQDISRLDIDLAKQHIQNLYDSILRLEKSLIEQRSENPSGSEAELSDIDEFLLDLDEDFADTYAELETKEYAKPEIEENPQDDKQDNSQTKITPPDSGDNSPAEKPEMPPADKTMTEKTANNETQKAIDSFDTTSGNKHTNSTPTPNEELPPQTNTGNISPAKHSSKTMDKTGDESKTLFDLFEEQPQTNLQDKVSHHKIDNIRSVIGINEKFRFINELFKGDMNTYNLVIDQLNTLQSIEEADRFLVTYKARYDWDEEGDVYNEFYTIVERRYQ
jgi:hypothetical protein